MPVRKKIEDLLYVRGMTPYAATMNAIAKHHRITPTDLARGLIESACAFYDEHGWFSFPVTVIPTVFQRTQAEHESPTQLAAEAPVPYEVTPAPKKKMPARIPRPTLPLPPARHESA